MIVIGNRQHALALLGHEAIHKLICKGRLNNILGDLLCFGPLTICSTRYRAFHMRHHKWLGTDKDPELPKKEAAGIIPENANNRYIWTRFIKDLFGLGLKDSIQLALGISKKDLWYWIPVNLAIISTGFINPLIPIIWYLCIPTTTFAFARFRVWHEHVGTKGTHLISPPKFLNCVFFPHGAVYHHEHHEHPAIPYQDLPKIASSDRVCFTKVHGKNA